jgi:hypothetical protein
MSDVSDPAVPAHLTLGWLYGVTAGLSIGAIAQSGTGILAAGAIGLPIGALVGTLVGTSTDVTEGDAAAADILMVHLSAIPLLFAAAASPDLSPQAVGGILLAGATLGVLAGELLNQDLHWSEGRWGAIGAIGGLGALVGLLVCVAASASGDGAFAVVGAFDALGLVIGVIATQGLWDEAPRGYHFPSSSPPAAQNALPPIQGPPGRAPTVYAAPLATFPFSL